MKKTIFFISTIGIFSLPSGCELFFEKEIIDDVKNISFIFDDELRISLRLLDGAKVVYSKCCGRSSEMLMNLDKRGETFHINPEIPIESEYSKRRRTDYQIIGIVTGWMLMIMLFMIFFWSELHHRTAIYYTLFILFVFLWIFSHWGMGFQYLSPQNVNRAGKYQPLLNLVSNVAILLTVINFFPPLHSQKLLISLMRILIWINSLLIASFLIIPKRVAQPETVAFFIKPVLVLSGIQILNILSFGTSQYLAKIQFAGIYLTGIVFLRCFTIFLYFDKATGTVQLSHYFLNFGSAFGNIGLWEKPP